LSGDRGIVDAAYAYHLSPRPEILEQLLAVIGRAFAVPPDHECHFCGMTDTENEDNGFGPLTDVRVIIANGEEGFADITRWVCNDHLISVTEDLRRSGFSEHRHGGINFLEDMDCPGSRNMDDCPSPAPDE
jgi:hypothetical protein